MSAWVFMSPASGPVGAYVARCYDHDEGDGFVWRGPDRDNTPRGLDQATADQTLHNRREHADDL